MNIAFSALSRRTPGVHGRGETYENNFTWGDDFFNGQFLQTATLISGTARDAGHFSEASPLTQKLVSGITQANPAVVTSTAHGFSNGDVVSFKNVEGMTQLNGRSFVVASVTANTFALTGEDSTSHGAYTQRGVITLLTASTTVLRPGLLMAFDTSLGVNGMWTNYAVSGGHASSNVIKGAVWREINVQVEGTNETRDGAEIITAGFWRSNLIIKPGNRNLGIVGDTDEAAIRTLLKTTMGGQGVVLDDFYRN